MTRARPIFLSDQLDYTAAAQAQNVLGGDPPPARAPSEPSTWSITRRNLGAWGAPVSSLEVLEVMSA